MENEILINKYKRKIQEKQDYLALVNPPNPDKKRLEEEIKVLQEVIEALSKKQD